MGLFNFVKCKIRGENTTEELIKLGMVVGNNFHRMGGVWIDYSHCWLIEIRDNVTLAPGVRLIAHDASTKMLLGYAKIGKIIIGNNVFIGAGTTILPNVHIGNDVIIGAGSVVTSDIPEGTVAAGNPAKEICSLSDYVKKEKERMSHSRVFDNSYTLRGGVDNKKKEKMKTVIEEIAFIE